MTIHIVLFTSLSCDPVVEPFGDPIDARSRMQRILTDGGWPLEAAREAATKGSSVTVRDDGDDDTVRILVREVR
jgi:hypothetical protein